MGIDSETGSVLSRLISDIEAMIASGLRLPWNEPFFVGSIADLVNPQDKIDFAGNPHPKGRPYSGFVNPMFLIIGAEASRARNGAKKMDNRFIRLSSLTGKMEYRICKGAGLKECLPPSGYVEYSEYRKWQEKAAEVASKVGITVFVPMKSKKDNPDFNPAKPAGKGNEKETWYHNGRFSSGTVINVADTNLVEIGYLPPLDETDSRDNPSSEKLETIICGYPQHWEAAECTPHYNITTGIIKTPELHQAKSALAYYSTRCHELAHQIQDMLGIIKGKCDRDAYSQSELSAEMTAAYVLGSLGFVTEESDEFKNSEAYIRNWLSHLKDDPEMLLNAAREAQRIGDLILKGNLPKVINNPEKFTFLPAEAA